MYELIIFAICYFWIMLFFHFIDWYLRKKVVEKEYNEWIKGMY